MPVTLTWNDIKTEIERRLQQTDKRLRRANGDEQKILQGKAQAYEELLNLPEAIKTQEKVNG